MLFFHFSLIANKVFWLRKNIIGEAAAWKRFVGFVKLNLIEMAKSLPRKRGQEKESITINRLSYSLKRSRWIKMNGGRGSGFNGNGLKRFSLHLGVIGKLRGRFCQCSTHRKSRNIRAVPLSHDVLNLPSQVSRLQKCLRRKAVT